LKESGRPASPSHVNPPGCLVGVTVVSRDRSEKHKHTGSASRFNPCSGLITLRPSSLGACQTSHPASQRLVSSPSPSPLPNLWCPSLLEQYDELSSPSRTRVSPLPVHLSRPVPSPTEMRINMLLVQSESGWRYASPGAIQTVRCCSEEAE
jgi:hypothetical protein